MIKIKKEFAQLPPFICMTEEINLSLLHILKNAFDAVSDDGWVLVENIYSNNRQW